MSDYKRLISYVYMYQNNEKSRNVGFVKLESRNGQCKIVISLRGIPSGNMDMEVFLYSYDKSISVGKIYLRNGQGESRIVTEQDNLVNSGITLDEIGGLKIQNHATPNTFYATIWDDSLMEGPGLHVAEIDEKNMEEVREAKAKEVQEARVEETRVEETREVMAEEVREAVAREGEQEVPESVLDEDSEQLGEQTNFEEYIETANKVMESLISTIFPNESKNPEAEEPQIRADRGMESEVAFEAASLEEVKNKADPDPEQKAEPEIPVNAKAEFNMEAAQYIENPVEEKVELLKKSVIGTFPSEAVRPEEQRGCQEPVKDTAQAAYEEEYHEAINQHKEPVKLKTEEHKTLWKNLEQKFPKVRNIACDKPHEILSITPQDIGLLPREAWVYGNNSFLLHGYYQYRYLVLICMNIDSDKERYLIGVPGVYHNNERFMATMFGFPNFYLARKQNSKTGQFGYWCSEIKLT